MTLNLGVRVPIHFSRRNQIDFPIADLRVQFVKIPGTDGNDSNCFIAVGRSSANVHIKGRLTDSTGKQIGKAKTLMAAPNWIILFSDVPNPQNPAAYKLQITDLDDELLGKSGSEISFETSPDLADAAIKPLLVTFGNPNSTNNVVPPTFTASGRTDSVKDVIGTLTGNGAPIVGNTVQDGPLWVIQFTDVPPGTYSFTVVAPPSSATLNPLIVTP